MKFSASMLKTFQECALQAKFSYMDQRPQQTGSAALFGSAVHEAIDMYHNGHTEEQCVAYFIDFMNNNEPDYWNRRTTLSGYLDQGVTMIREYVKSRQWSDTEVIASEFRFMVDIGEHQFSGIIDSLMLPNDHSALYIVDLKGLALDTVLPTPTGWTTMGDVAVGDILLGSDGKPCTVTAKSNVHYNPCYRITFDDKSEIICDHEHYWKTLSGQQNPKEKVLTTKEIHDTLFGNSAQPQRQHRVLNTMPLDLDEANLPIHPYVLGYWLGNGKHTSSEISSSDEEVYQRFEELGYEVGPDIGSGSSCPTKTVYKIRSLLSEMNLFRNKHVPSIYMRASIEQRLELLRGLMDSDGCWNIERQQCNFTNTNETLARNVYEIVCSLGWRANFWSGPYEGFGVSGTGYYVNFTPFNLNPFYIYRKAILVRLEGTTPCRRRLVIAVEEIPTVPTQCITVDSEDHTYLCGESMIPTHNTGKRPILDALYLNIQFTGYHWATYQKEFWCGYPGQEDKYSGFENGEELWEYFKDIPREGYWLDLKKMEYIYVGPRGPLDFARMYRLMEQVDRAVQLDACIPTIDESTCTWCAYQDICPVYHSQTLVGDDLNV